jgi:hypothetical protein
VLPQVVSDCGQAARPNRQRNQELLEQHSEQEGRRLRRWRQHSRRRLPLHPDGGVGQLRHRPGPGGLCFSWDTGLRNGLRSLGRVGAQARAPLLPPRRAARGRRANRSRRWNERLQQLIMAGVDLRQLR